MLGPLEKKITKTNTKLVHGLPQTCITKDEAGIVKIYHARNGSVSCQRISFPPEGDRET